VRFGTRLQVERSIDESALECQVPPLVLQPLLENAVGHGIAGLIDGGTIRLDVVRHGDRLAIAVENPRDPDAMPRARGGVGLENVRKRLAIVFGGAARIDAVASPTGFRVAIDLPSTLDA
jgi:LytS/YehU family sensor histidine kinase